MIFMQYYHYIFYLPRYEDQYRIYFITSICKIKIIMRYREVWK